jgi:hypothetical protein
LYFQLVLCALLRTGNWENMGILTVFTLVHGLCIKNRARDPMVRTSAELIGQGKS